MLLKDIQKIIDELADGEPIKFTFGGSDILIRLINESLNEVHLRTSVYMGGNYIPSSVRRCLSEKDLVPHSSIRTFLTVDEGRYQVNLNYLGQLQHLSDIHFREVLEEFDRIADTWRLYLDEHDKKDLLYIHIKR